MSTTTELRNTLLNDSFQFQKHFTWLNILEGLKTLYMVLLLGGSTLFIYGYTQEFLMFLQSIVIDL